MKANRFTIKIGGESGQGINVAGELLVKALKNSGYYVFGYREYPSLIMGGYSSYQIDISDKQISSPSKKVDLLITLSRVSTHKYVHDLNENGKMVHVLPRLNFTKDENEYIENHSVKFEYIDALKIIKELKGNNLMINMLMLGVMWQIMGLEIDKLKEAISNKFKSKPDLLALDLEFLKYGFNYELELEKSQISLQTTDSLSNDKIITGNYTLALGAITAGVRALYSYPMTPASSILSYLAKTYHDTGILVKQAEDEITAAQMAIGSMYAGTRSLVATSGGGFDLMTETVSLSGITETPFVCVIAQRPGPGTGLPTWTSAGDLNIAVYAGHGEFPRCVLAVSDAESAYLVIQNAYNIAEEYQIPVIVLTEKQIAESLYQVKELPESIEIQRHLLSGDEILNITNKDRFKFTESGISPRWIPGQSDAVYNSNSDEHDEEGAVVEDAIPAKKMLDKRMKKIDSLTKSLPDPVLYGTKDADITFVGWGSVKSTVLDAIEEAKSQSKFKINYLHYEYIYPLKTDVFSSLFEQNSKIVLIENNALGQLGELITSKTGFQFEKKLLKYDGRPFFIEEILEFIENINI